MNETRYVVWLRAMIALALSFTLAASCRDVQPRSAAERLVRHSQFVSGDTLLTARGVRLIPVARIDGELNQLVFVGSAGLRRDGVVAVIQDQNFQVLFFDSSGTLVASTGREGAGPGEFRSLRYSGWVGDTLWAWDNRLDRISFVDPRTFKVSRTVRLGLLRPAPNLRDSLPDFELVYLLGVYDDGTFLAGGTRASRSRKLNGAGTPLIRTSQRGIVRELVGWISPGQDRAGYGTGSVLIPFAPDRLFAASPHGDRVGMVISQKVLRDDVSTVTLRTIDSHGGGIFERSYEFPAERIPDGRRDSLIQDRLNRVRGQAARALRSAAIPHHYAVIRELVMGSDGSIWLRLRDESGASRSRWVILNRNGEVVDTAYLPRNARLMAVDTARVLLRETGEYDVHSLLVLRVHGIRTAQ
jgi:hypothetical protein